MALAITATLSGDETPQAVQLLITGATSLDTYTVNGTWSGGVWQVRGGASTPAAGTQIVLADVASPINVSITYTVTHDLDGAQVTTSPLTVPYSGQSVIQSIDGQLSTPFIWMNNSDPLSTPMRSSLFTIPGRPDPVVRYDVPSTNAGTLQILTEGAQTPALQTILAQAGGLLLIRGDGTLMDFPAVQYLLVVNNSRTLGGITGERIWNLDYVAVGDPEPNTIISVDTWDDFDSAYSALTWTNFDTEWSTLNWDAFDVVDWANR